METVTPFKEIIDAIKASGGDAFKYCYQCGMCDTVCPWNRVRNFSMRKLVGEATFGLTEIESEDIWRCTTCGKCPQVCPRGVKQIESGVALRRIATEYGVFPQVGASRSAPSPPACAPRATRSAKTAPSAPSGPRAWRVKPFTEGMEILYFPCCYLSLRPAGEEGRPGHRRDPQQGRRGFRHPRRRRRAAAARASARPATRRCSSSLARQNITTFIDHGVKKILVSSPHCYHTFKNEYPEFMVHFEVVHISQFLLTACSPRAGCS